MPAPIRLLLAVGPEAAQKAALASGFPTGKSTSKFPSGNFYPMFFYHTPCELLMPWVPIQPRTSCSVVRRLCHSTRLFSELMHSLGGGKRVMGSEGGVLQADPSYVLLVGWSSRCCVRRKLLRRSLGLRICRCPRRACVASAQGLPGLGGMPAGVSTSADSGKKLPLVTSVCGNVVFCYPVCSR